MPGLATGIGSLPYVDPHVAASATIRLHPRLPAAPQLPNPREGVIAQWATALPEVSVARDGTLSIDLARAADPIVAAFDQVAHAGLLAFVDAAAGDPEIRRVKLQVVGPLTLAVALVQGGMPTSRAVARASTAVRAWIDVLEAKLAERLPGVGRVIFLDEPSLVLWRHDRAPIERDEAVDVLSGSLAAIRGISGVHVCGDGDVRVAFEAGPTVLGAPVSPALLHDADVFVRHLDADGWVAWGAVPTDRPIGESSDAPWRDLVSVWCEFTRRGCDPVRLRTHAIITPACGLASFGPTQAERALRLAREIANRVGDQAVAARLTVGA
jgi:hypothetical protein